MSKFAALYGHNHKQEGKWEHQQIVDDLDRGCSCLSHAALDSRVWPYYTLTLLLVMGQDNSLQAALLPSPALDNSQCRSLASCHSSCTTRISTIHDSNLFSLLWSWRVSGEGHYCKIEVKSTKGCVSPTPKHPTSITYTQSKQMVSGWKQRWK